MRNANQLANLKIDRNMKNGSCSKDQSFTSIRERERERRFKSESWNFSFKDG